MINPKGLFQEMMDAMPDRFFQIYNALRAEGYEHRKADELARKQCESEGVKV